MCLARVIEDHIVDTIRIGSKYFIFCLVIDPNNFVKLWLVEFLLSQQEMAPSSGIALLYFILCTCK
jgi:hypothetical protein